MDSRRDAVVLLLLLFLLLALSSGPSSSDSDAGGGGGGGGNPEPPIANQWRLLAERIYDASRGPIFPANLSVSERYSGSWGTAGLAALDVVRPILAPNLTVQYGLYDGPSPPSKLELSGSSGGITLRLESTPRFTSVPTLQRVEGLVTLTDAGDALQTLGLDGDGDSSLEHAADDDTTGGLPVFPGADSEQGGAGDDASPTPGASPAAAPGPRELALPASGLYIADEGLLVMVASRRPSGVGIISMAALEAAKAAAAAGGGDTAAAAAAAAAAEAAAAGSNSGRALGDEAGAPQPDGSEAQATPSAAAPPPPPAQPVPPPLRLSSLGSSCDVIFALKFRPLGKDVSLPFADPALDDWRRQLSEAGAWYDDSSASSVDEDASLWLASSGSTVVAEAAAAAEAAQAHTAWRGAAAAAFLRRALGLQQPEPQAPASAAAAPPRADSVPAPRRLSSASPSGLYSGAHFVGLYGHAVSLNCNFTLNISASAATWDIYKVESKADAYSLLATTSSICIMVALAYQAVHSASSSSAGRISVLTVAAQAMFDAYACLLHLVAGFLTPALFASFATASFIDLLLFSTLDMRFLLHVWKAHNAAVFEAGWDTIRREVSALYCRFYGVLLGGLLLLMAGTWGAAQTLIFGLSCAWIPQIIHSVKADCRPGVTPGYVLVSTAARLALPLYFLACPSNVLLALTLPEGRGAAEASLAHLNAAWVASAGSSPDAPAWASRMPIAYGADVPGAPAPVPSGPGAYQAYPWMPAPGTPGAYASPSAAASYASSKAFAIFLCVWSGVQMAIVLLQGKAGWGPRFFVPAVFLPKRYDYHRVVTVVGARVVPDAEATAAWIRPRPGQRPTSPPAAAGGGGEGGGGGGDAPAPPQPTRLQSLRASLGSSVSNARASAATAASNTAWFFRTLAMWAGDVRRRAGVAARRSAPGRLAARLGLAPRRGAASYARLPPAQREEQEEATSSRRSGGASAAGTATPAAVVANPLARRSGGGSTTTTASASAPAISDAEIEDGARAPRRGSDDDSGAEGGGSSARGRTASDIEAGSSSGAGGAAGESAVAGGGAGDGPTSEQLDELVSGVSANSGDEPPAIDCMVCLEPVTFPLRRREYMVTPCDHLLHTPCLSRWLETKLECPVCRMPLPEP